MKYIRKIIQFLLFWNKADVSIFSNDLLKSKIQYEIHKTSLDKRIPIQPLIPYELHSQM